MSKQNVLKSTLWLTGSGMLAKTIDFVFRAYYSKKLGSEGMGLFSLVFGIHGIMLTFATAGLGVAVSKIVSGQYGQGNFLGIKKTMRIAIGLTTTLSVVVISLAFMYGDEVAKYFLKDERCAQSIKYLAPSILFMGVSYCIKGYFYAMRKVLRPASSEFLEQFVKIVTITNLLGILLPKGIEYGCQGVFLGITIGEFSSCTYLSILYVLDSKYLKQGKVGKRLFKSIFKVSLPSMTSSLIGSFLRMQEDVWIVSSFRKYKMSNDEALSKYGMMCGMIMPLLIFPLTLLSSFVTLLIPEISRAEGTRNNERLNDLISKVYKFAILSGTIVMCVFITFSVELSKLVYNNKDIAGSVRYLAFLCPIMFVDSISMGILNGLGQQFKLLKYNILDSVLRLSMIYFLIPLGGFNMLLYMTIASNIFTCYLTVKRVFKLSPMVFDFRNWLLKPLLSSGMAFFVTRPIYKEFLITSFSLKSSVILGILLLVAVYMSLNIVIGGISKKDLKWIISRLKPA